MSGWKILVRVRVLLKKASVDESVKERDRCQFLKELNNKTKLTIYKSFGKEVKLKRYGHGVSDAGTHLLFKLRSGTHGLNEELGRHRGKDGCVPYLD